VLVQIAVVGFVAGRPVTCRSHEGQKCAKHDHESEDRRHGKKRYCGEGQVSGRGPTPRGGTAVGYLGVTRPPDRPPAGLRCLISLMQMLPTVLVIGACPCKVGRFSGRIFQANRHTSARWVLLAPIREL
jgi:hypothetical protein